VTRIQAGESRSSLIVSWRNPNDLVWLPWSWLLLLFVSNIKPTTRDAREAITGSASVDNLIELGVYGLIAAGCIAALARHRHSPTRSAGVMMLTSFGLLAVASAAWSSVPVFSVVRGSQIIVVALLTIVSVEAWRSKLRDVVADWIRIWQGYAIVVMALVVFGVLMGPSESRFRWPGTEPIMVGSYLALAAVVVLSMLLERGWRFPRPKLALMSVLVVVFVTFMLVNTTRSTLAGFAVGAIAVYLTRSARRLDLRWLIVPFAGLAGAIRQLCAPGPVRGAVRHLERPYGYLVDGVGTGVQSPRLRRRLRGRKGAVPRPLRVGRLRSQPVGGTPRRSRPHWSGARIGLAALVDFGRRVSANQGARSDRFRLARRAPDHGDRRTGRDWLRLPGSPPHGARFDDRRIDRRPNRDICREIQSGVWRCCTRVAV